MLDVTRWLRRSPASRSVRILIGTQAGDAAGIYLADYDAARRVPGPARLAAATGNPSCVIAGGRADLFHAVVETGGPDGGLVRSYVLRRARLRLVGQCRSGGDSPCHLALAPDGTFLAVANYGGGASAIDLGPDGGVAGAPRLLVPAAGTEAEGRSRPHWASFRDGFLWITDFGLDCVHVFPLAEWQARRTIPFPVGSGPRTLAWHPRLPLAYVVCERDNVIRVLETDRAGGAGIVAEHATLPVGAPASAAAHVALDPEGTVLLASNRGHDSLAVFLVRPDGRLEAAGHASSGGRHPRHFAFAPDGSALLVANRDSDEVVALRLQSGRPGEPVGATQVRGPAWVTFVIQP